MVGSLYKITNKANGKVYIGKTYNSLDQRFSEHVRDSRKPKNRPLYKAFRKYGPDNFTMELIGNYEEGVLEAKETEAIYKYDSYRNGYNVTLGGDGKKHFFYSDEEVVLKYLELGYLMDTAQYFKCDPRTIRGVLKRNSIDINSHNDDKSGGLFVQEKCVMLDLDSNPIREFKNNAEAASYLIAEGITASGYRSVRKGISKAVCGDRKTYLNYKWSR